MHLPQPPAAPKHPDCPLSCTPLLNPSITTGPTLQSSTITRTASCCSYPTSSSKHLQKLSAPYWGQHCTCIWIDPRTAIPSLHTPTKPSTHLPQLPAPRWGQTRGSRAMPMQAGPACQFQPQAWNTSKQEMKKHASLPTDMGSVNFQLQHLEAGHEGSRDFTGAAQHYRYWLAQVKEQGEGEASTVSSTIYHH